MSALIRAVRFHDLELTGSLSSLKAWRWLMCPNSVCFGYFYATCCPASFTTLNN